MWACVKGFQREPVSVNRHKVKMVNVYSLDDMNFYMLLHEFEKCREEI